MLLNAQGVTKSFGDFKALDQFELTVPPGEVIGLLGPNGAGKTTFMRMVCGLISVSSGEIKLFKDHRPGEAYSVSQIGYMPQHLAVYPGLSVRENILFYGRIYGVDEKTLNERCEELLEVSRLVEKAGHSVSELSGGMVRRLMMTTALIHKPRLIILDEPTAGVDPVLRLEFWDWFRKLADSQTAILITTHHISEAVRCDRVVFLRQGRVLETGAPQGLIAKYEAEDLEAAFVKASRV